ncbi:MAG TPA: glycosyltransferase family 2 protein [Solirubrobacterales bacterium]|nr:glycosyltransferase family 2 protein [Solirubrobacterales bacterium]
MSPTDLSIVIPVLNESEALPDLLEEIRQACDALGVSWEAIVVDDGSTDGSFDLVEELASERPWLRGVRLRRNFGKSAALAAGFERSRGETVVTIDGDGQDDPADIPALLARLEEGADLASGWKQDRQDPLSRRLASKVFNRITGWLTGVSMHDMNCGFKAYRGACARSLEVYGELHRYMPVLASQQGWRVAEVPVNHRPRRHGRSRFGLERYLRGALDLLTVVFLGRYQDRPLHLFGGLGLFLTSIGAVIELYLLVVKIAGHAIGERPLLFLGLLLIVVGVQLLTFGLLAQMVVLNRREVAGSALEPAQVERVIEAEGAGEADLSRGGRDSARSATGTLPPA